MTIAEAFLGLYNHFMEYDIKDQAVPLPEAVSNAIAAGYLDFAISLIDGYLEKDIPSSMRRRLLMEKDLIRRRKSHYIYTYEEAEELLEKAFADYRRGMLEEYISNGLLDWSYINGKLMLEKRLVDNAAKRCSLLQDGIDPDLKKRDMCIKLMEEKGAARARIGVKETLRIKDPSLYGKKVLVNLPFIKPVDNMISSISLENTSGNIIAIGDEMEEMRTLRFIDTIKDDTSFFAEFSYDIEAIKNGRPEEEDIMENMEEYLKEEAPHILFTPYMIELAREITKDIHSPWKKAEAIYDWITTHILYSFIRSYATIDNISTYAAANLKGDCGVQALLFITLCRASGIPARWQSGWYVTEDGVSCHDWAEFNISGKWYPADCSFGGGAYRRREEKRWKHYFASLDIFRMVANTSCSKALEGKKAPADDPVDNQRGEVETCDGERIGRDAFETTLETVSFLIL